MALVDGIALLEYDVGGRRGIHERLILQHLSGDEYAVLTPDGDVYIEEMAVTNSELRSFRVRPAPEILPPGVNPADVYALPAYSPADLAGFRAEAQRVVNAETAARRGAAVVAAQPVAAVAPVGAAAVVLSAVVRTPGVLQWLAAESVPSIQYGDPIQGVVALSVDGARSVHTMADGSSIFVQCVDGSRIDEFMGRRRTFCL